MYNNKFGMFETPGFSEDFPVHIKEREIPILRIKIIDDLDAIHAWFHVWSLRQFLNVCNYQPELFFSS